MNTSNQKPDLTGAAPGANDKARILSHLEHGARRPAAKPVRASGWTIDGWTIGLVLLLVIMCSVAWWMHDTTITPGEFSHGYRDGLAGKRRDGAPLSAAMLETVDKASAELSAPVAPVAALPAAIINDPHMAADPLAKAIAKTHAAAAAAGPTATATATSPTSPTPRIGATAAWSGAGAHKAVAANAAPVRQTSRAAAAPKTAGTGDADVALLTALVAHAKTSTPAAHERGAASGAPTTPTTPAGTTPPPALPSR